MHGLVPPCALEAHELFQCFLVCEEACERRSNKAGATPTVDHDSSFEIWTPDIRIPELLQGDPHEHRRPTDVVVHCRPPNRAEHEPPNDARKDMVREVDNRPIETLSGPGFLRAERVPWGYAVHVQHNAHRPVAASRCIEQEVAHCIADLRHVV